MKFIIAKFNEDTRWAEKVNHLIIQKGVDMPNVGREASSYLKFIVDNYDNLGVGYVFCQGHPFDHCPNFLEEIKSNSQVGRICECDNDGLPDHIGLKIKEFCKKLGIVPRKKYTFRAGAQFKVMHSQIRERSKEWYNNAYKLSLEDPQAPWIFERLWSIIFNLK